MIARRALMQLATKLAIGLGALFLVGVLLAAIPNHRAPVVQGFSATPGQIVQRADHSAASGLSTDDTKSRAADAGRNTWQGPARAARASDPAR